MTGEFKVLRLGPIGTNTYLIDNGAGGVVVIDPADESDVIVDALGGRPVDVVLVTHAHWDHVGALDAIAALSPRGFMVGALDAPRLTCEDILGRPGSAVVTPPARLLADGDTVTSGELTLHVIACPGHTPGGVTYLDEERGNAFVGDTLFPGSCGRCDLAGGDEEAMVATLGKLTRVLAPTVKVHCGHGASTNMAREYAWNPYIQVALG